MTTKLRVSKFRRRPNAPLFPGVDPEAVRRATRERDARARAEQEAERRAGEAAATMDPVQAAVGAGMTVSSTGGSAQAPDSGGARVRQGEVSSAAEVDSETQIAAIRREGLTGRQLRMARRTAQKHGLAPTSDFDAVRLLRARGIDPFDRANMLQLVPSPGGGGSGDTGSGDAPGGDKGQGDPGQGDRGQGGLPQTVPQHPTPAVQQPAPHPGIKVPEDRAGEIYKIQRDIARRRRRRGLLLVARLSFFVFLPTLLAGWYFAFLATPMYATHSEFVIQQSSGSAGGAGGLGGLFQGTGLAVQQDSTTVQSYLQSRDAMLRLDRDQGFKAHFSQDFIDPLQRLEDDASNEDAYDVYQDNVRVGFDPTEGILKMEVIAASPEASQRFSEALIGYAEEQVDNLTQRLRADQMEGAREAYEQAERRVVEAQARVLELQERLGVLDPASETGSIMQQITQFETQLRQKQLELESLLANTRPSEARVAGVRGEISRLEDLVADLRSSMTESASGEASLARVSGELRIAEADLATRQMLLQQAAQQLETARIEANRQVRYMAMGVAPIAPDEPTYPRVFENTALAFLIFAGIYLMLSLTASVLREQVSA